MATIACPKGTPPVASTPPQKPMPQSKRRMSRGSCLGGLSCFGRSPVAGSDAGHPLSRGRATATWFTWSRFRKKKKTVPVDASATELLPEKIIGSGNVVQQRPHVGEGEAPAVGQGGYGGEHEEATREQPRQGPGPNKMPLPAAAAVRSQGFFWSLRKSNKDGASTKAQNVESHRNRVSASLETKQQPRLPSISPKYAAGRGSPRASPPPEPAPTVSRRLCLSRTATPPAAPRRSSTSASSPSASPARAKPPPGPSRLGGARPHKKSEERPPAAAPCPSNVGRNDQVVGLSVLAVVLVVMLPFGRVSAVIFTCAWFYILPWLREAATSEAGGGESDAGVDDWDSEEYKKRVVLEGLLQREGRRASVFA